MSTPPDHARHDELLVVRYAGHDVDAGERAAAEALIDDCLACAALAADLVALVHATSALPAPARPRDFTLSADDFARLRGSPLRRFFDRLAAANLGFVQPLASAVVAIGLAVVVVNSLPMMAPGASGGAMPMSESYGVGGTEPDVMSSPGATAAAAPGAVESEPPRDRNAALDTQRTREEAEQGLPTWLIVGSLLVFAGVVLFAARWIAVRQMRDPRLQ